MSASTKASARASAIAKELRESIAFSLRVWAAGRFLSTAQQRERRGVESAAQEILAVIGHPCDAITVEVQKAIAAAIAEARAEQDQEWRDAVGGVPGVDATPEACKRWQVALREQARAEEREAIAHEVEFWGECRECGSAETLHDIAAAIRARGGKPDVE